MLVGESKVMTRQQVKNKQTSQSRGQRSPQDAREYDCILPGLLVWQAGRGVKEV